MSTTGVNVASTGITMSNPLSGSGIDVNSVVSQLETEERAPETQLKDQQQTIQTQQSALSQINQDLSSLLTSVQSLTDFTGALASTQASSSDSSIVNATTSSGAATGNHTVTVSRLATVSSLYSDELSSASSSFTPGTLVLTMGSSSTPITINLSSSDGTLSGAASYINGQNLGLTASVVTDSSGARLAITSNTSGASGNLQITSSPSGLAFHSGATGQDAQLTVDGVPVDSATNTVTGAIPGVTLTLGSAAPGTQVTVAVTPDVNSATQAVNQFVSSYNTAIGDINAQFTYNSTTDTQGPLGTDSTLSDVQSQLLQLMTYTTTGNSSFSSLADLGITMNDDGTLSVDSSTLNAAVQNNDANFQQFMQSSSGFAMTLQNSLNTLTNPAQGPLYVDSQGLQSTYNDLQDQINNIETQISSQHDNLVQQYSDLNALLEEYPTQESEMNELLGLSNSSSTS